MYPRALLLCLLLLLRACSATRSDSAAAMFLAHATRQAQNDFCIPLTPCCVRYRACTTARCTSFCDVLRRRCASIDTSQLRNIGYIPFCANAATAQQCFSWCMSRQCGALYCNGNATPWTEFPSFAPAQI